MTRPQYPSTHSLGMRSRLLDEHIDAETAQQFASYLFGEPGALGVVPTHRDLEYISTHGERFSDPQSCRKYGRSGACYENAAKATWKDPSLSYVQGFARGRIGVVFAHAWCVDENGRLVETTWKADLAQDFRYFGVRFTHQQLAQLLTHYRHFGWHEGFSSVLARGEHAIEIPRIPGPPAPRHGRVQ